MRDVFSIDIINYLEKKLSHNNNYENLFEDLQNNLSPRDLINCYKYILENKKDVLLLNKTIRHINKTRYIDCMNFLIDFIRGENQNADLKVLAIKAVSNYKNTACVPVLLECLNDKNSNYKIRLASAEALGTIGDKNAFDSLSNIINDEQENSAYVKESAVVALGMLGDTRAIDVFDTIINTKQIFLDKFSYLKERIVEAMSKFDISRDKKAIEILKNTLLDNKPRIRISAIEAVSNSGFDCAYDLIYDRLIYDDDMEVKKNALVALYNLSDRKILDEVLHGEFDFELKKYAKELIDENEKNNG